MVDADDGSVVFVLSERMIGNVVVDVAARHGVDENEARDRVVATCSMIGFDLDEHDRIVLVLKAADVGGSA